MELLKSTQAAGLRTVGYLNPLVTNSDSSGNASGCESVRENHGSENSFISAEPEDARLLFSSVQAEETANSRHLPIDLRHAFHEGTF